MLDAQELSAAIRDSIMQQVACAGTTTEYRTPLVAFVAAQDPRFAELPRDVGPHHFVPEDLLSGARTVVAYFLPFERTLIDANARHRDEVSLEWATAYVETNALLSQISARLGVFLASNGIRSAAEPPTHSFDTTTLVSHWSHKSVAVVAGLGSFGLHQMVITDAGCAGRFGSLVIDALLPPSAVVKRERCLYFADGSCLECVQRCPVGALDAGTPLDKHRCYQHLRTWANQYTHLGGPQVCGKCAIGPCSLESAV